MSAPRGKHSAGRWSVVQTLVAGGTVVYTTSDAAKLFDYVRRGPLSYLTSEADRLRVDHAVGCAAA